MLTWPNEDDRMSVTEICEHDQILDNDERECVELDQKNKKFYHNDQRWCVNMTEKRFLSFGHTQPRVLVILIWSN